MATILTLCNILEGRLQTESKDKHITETTRIKNNTVGQLSRRE